MPRPTRRRCKSIADVGTEATLASEGSGTPSMTRSAAAAAGAAIISVKSKAMRK
jgi:hypothetical protein